MIVLIRHGETPGNLEKRYVGTTDEDITADAKARLSAYEICEDRPVKKVYVSPYIRTKSTASILFPKACQFEVSDMREMDFGEYEYKNYTELQNEVAYQRFIDSNGWEAFPGGESREDFTKRCVEAFKEILDENPNDDVYIVTHGGTIMAIMEAMCRPRRDFYEWQVKPGEGYVIEADNGEGYYHIVGICDGSTIRRS